MKIESQIIPSKNQRTTTEAYETTLIISGTGSREECELLQEKMLNFDRNEKIAFKKGEENIRSYVIRALSSILLREDYGKEILYLKDILSNYNK